MRCSHCHSMEQKRLYRIRSGSGVSMVAWYCTECEGWAQKPMKWLKKEEVLSIIGPYGKTIEDLHLLKDHAIPCEICNASGAEYHHWAPQSLEDLFGEDWHKWPGSYLCKKHHDLWHEIITPDMPGRGSTGLGMKARLRWQTSRPSTTSQGSRAA